MPRIVTLYAILYAIKERAVEHGQTAPFHSIGRDLKLSTEYCALRICEQRGYPECAQALRDAGVPSDLDPQFTAVVDPHSRAFNPHLIADAMRLFGSNAPMAFGYLVGKQGLESRSPPGGWATLDPGGVKAKALRDQYVAAAQIRDLRSKVNFVESERLRDELLLEQELREQETLRSHPSDPVLLAFVCNPDRLPDERGHLPRALNDAIAVSHEVPARIIGGATYAGKSPAQQHAVTEDRTCTFERLGAELARRKFSYFLFSGHANVQEEGRPKTLGFTNAAGKFAPLPNPDEVATLLGSHAHGPDGLKLVVLNGCESEELGKLCCQRAVPVVVCWRTRVADEAAYLFVRGFFHKLEELGAAADHRYEEAFKAGKLAVVGKTRTERTDDGSTTTVPFFELRDPDELYDPAQGVTSYAAGVPVLHGAQWPSGYV